MKIQVSFKTKFKDSTIAGFHDMEAKAIEMVDETAFKSTIIDELNTNYKKEWKMSDQEVFNELNTEVLNIKIL